MTTIPQALSKGEEMFALHLRAKAPDLLYVREYVFHEKRRWRFDFWFPAQRIAVEIDGGNNGRHQRRAGFEGDCYKLNAAAKMGILVFRYTTAMVNDATAINDILEIMPNERAPRL